MAKKIIISLGGSLIHPDKLDLDFIKKFKHLIEEYIKKDFTFVIVCGGGKICREYQKAADDIRLLDNEEKDWLGIEVTKLNAHFIKGTFNKEDVYEHVLINPTIPLNTNKKIIVCSGYKPGCSTDYDAVLLAENLKADTIINMSNITHVCDCDPKHNRDAKKLCSISWKEYRSLIGDTWSPGLNTPFDPIASKKAEELGLKVIIIGKDLDNLKNLLDDKSFEGTEIR